MRWGTYCCKILDGEHVVLARYGMGNILLQSMGGADKGRCMNVAGRSVANTQNWEWDEVGSKGAIAQIVAGHVDCGQRPQAHDASCRAPCNAVKS